MELAVILDMLGRHHPGRFNGGSKRFTVAHASIHSGWEANSASQPRRLR
jgi:hypothetical protein